MIWLAIYIGIIFASNWAVDAFGVVPVGFGLEAPAAVYFVGLSFTVRDLAHDAVGRRRIAAAIVVGAALSYAVAPSFAVASGVAFLLSEGADFAVYTPLRERHRMVGIVASNTVGLVIDSIVFLHLAFGSLDFLQGQIVGKAWMTLLAVAALAAWRTQSNAKRTA